MVQSSDKKQPTGDWNGKPLQHSCFENPMNSTKRQKDRTLKDEFPKSRGTPYGTGEISPEGMKRLSQRGNNTQLWMCLMVKVKSDTVRNNIA